MIRLRNVTVAYGDRVILDNINLDIHQGETLAILGASGSGKSTILRLIIGLQKPTKGHILFHDADITGYDEEQLTAVRRHMGMVFQYSALFDSMTVGRTLPLACASIRKTMKRRSSASLRKNCVLSAWRESKI